VTALFLALAAAYGVHLAWTALAHNWQGIGPGPRVERRRDRGATWRAWLAQAGLDGVRPVEFLAVMATLFVLGAGFVYAVFGGALPALVGGGFAASIPIATYRARRRRRREKAQEAWPRIIEEIRILTGSLGRSIPQALFEAGLRGPDELRSGFEAAQREWLLSTDFSRTVSVLKQRLADPTADAACETLLVAYEVGGTDLARRLEALAEDRIQDVQGRKDARSKQAGARFARWFVLIVPLGMAAAGLMVGPGREAYAEPGGQLGIVLGIAMIIVCWVWAGRIMQVPAEERVFEQ
jgi:tight adherence protein B